MVIVSLFFRRRIPWTFLVALAFILPALRSSAEDQIIKNDGSVITGRIIRASDGRVMVESHTSNGGILTGLYYISDIKSISMAVPADVAKVQAPNVAAADVIAALEPQIKQFAGLPADWVVGAMAQLGEAYSETGQTDKALAIYNQIIGLYPGSAYESVAKAGEAGLSLKAGRIDEALAAVQPIVNRANQDIAPSPSDGALYANAFLVYGQVLEAQMKPQQALEAYLTVKTMFYQNPTLVAQADQFAKNLRDHHPGLGIE